MREKGKKFLGGIILLFMFQSFSYPLTYGLNILPPKMKKKIKELHKEKTLLRLKKSELRKRKIIFRERNKKRYKKHLQIVKRNIFLLEPRRRYKDLINTYEEINPRVQDLIENHSSFPLKR